jgi:hypothetical protein
MVDVQMTLSNEATDASINCSTPSDSASKFSSQSIYRGAFIHEATPNMRRREGLASKPLAS